MVRLRDYLRLVCVCLSINFNSSMVRLRAAIVDVVAAWSLEFQFLYGAIKRLYFCDLGYSKQDFNSSMVRLRVVPSMLLRSSQTNFNSSMVRLRDNCRGIPCWYAVTFQFLYGAIKRLSASPSISWAPLFQFLYGAIKSAYSQFFFKFNVNFNSSMVRLRVW